MQKGKKMDKTLKCIYVMVLFLSIFLVVKKVDGKPYFHHLKKNFTLYFLYNILSHLVTLFHSYFIAALYKCENVEDCPQLYEFTTIDYKCILGTCVPLGVIRKQSAHNYRAENNEFLH